MKKAGFELVSECWLCVYYNSTPKLMLVVYVDDMKLSEPAEEMAKAWKELGEQIKLEVPKGDKV